MFPFWEIAIAPVIDAVQPKKVVEIGALKGETTVLMLDRLGPGVELHVIDPLPDFDPDEHAAAFPGRYIFHRDLSLNALPDMAPMDVALIDGDHNWYTVYNEMKQLAATARDAGAPLPVMIMHDVLWPYGRRDLYYGPDQIPAEFRQPYEKKGIRRGESELRALGGVNPELHNATHEGGPRNGVMTGVDDFIAEYDKPLRVLVLPIYFGLAIVVEEEQVAANPALAAILDHLEGPDGRLELLELAESERLRSVESHHDLSFRAHRRINFLSKQYLRLVKASLLDEHYIENELRIITLLGTIRNGAELLVESFRNPTSQMRSQARELLAARESGDATAELTGSHASYLPYTAIGRTRLNQLEKLLDSIRNDYVQGDFVDCGGGRGGVGIFMRAYLAAHALGNRKVWIADEFRAYRDADVEYIDNPGTIETRDDEPSEPTTSLEPPVFDEMRYDLNGVREAFSRYDLLDARVRFVQGDYLHTLPKAKIKQVALLRIGPDAGYDATTILRSLYPRMNLGGYVLIENFDDPAVQEAVAAYRSTNSVSEQIVRQGSAALWRKKSEPVKVKPASPIRELRSRVRGARAGKGAPFVTLDRSADKDLSVVVCFYNMKREAARTLTSLTRNYQRNVDHLNYEVIVVENGSDDDQKLGAEYVAGFGKEFRYLDMADKAQPSPVFALNEALKIAGGEMIAVMIDGAHILTPGVLHHAMQASQQYEPAVVLTQQFYMGPGQQNETIAQGYDQATEDRLLDSISWPKDGYQLFKIGHFIGGRDWFDGQWESNCLFVPRALVDQTGGFDESFTEPGGGFANLEFYERVAATPGVSVATMLGEGSFHQIHGGTTTNISKATERFDRIMSYAAHYAQMRGKAFVGPRKPMHYVGTIFDDANRTRARRRTALRYFRLGMDGDIDGRPAVQEPIPEDVQTAFVEAYWHNEVGMPRNWLGTQVDAPPTDLFAYQSIINDVRPDWIIETGTGNGGRAHFLASVCDLVGNGTVISLDTTERDDRPAHDRIRYLTVTDYAGEETKKAVQELTGDAPNGFVIIGTELRRKETLEQFETFQELVPVGSYVVVESTVVGGNPVWPSFGPGPADGVKAITDTYPNFVADPDREPRGLTYNPGGYLRRES